MCCKQVNTYTVSSANTWERKTIVIAADTTNANWYMLLLNAIHMISLGAGLGSGTDDRHQVKHFNTWAGADKVQIHS